MNNLLREMQRLFDEADYATVLTEVGQNKLVAFENATVLGFAFAYDSPAQLIERWDADSRAAIAEHQLGLRRAQNKAWNIYTIFLAEAPASYGQMAALNVIEENLTGTRKIARGGLADGEDLRNALLPLLPVQNAPRLDPVDMAVEIRLRTTELPSQVVDAFLSGATASSMGQVLEETS